MATIRELEARIAKLEQFIQHAMSVVSDPITGAAPETYFVGMGELPSTEPAIVAPFPGCHVVVPPGCPLVIGNATDDPIVLAGNPTPVAAKAIKAMLALMPAYAAGCVIIGDPTVGTGAVIISSLGVHIVGELAVWDGAVLKPVPL